MTDHREGIATVNGVDIAWRVDGAGPPLLLIMGYRLSGRAWPAEFIAGLAAHFTVIHFDNRGTGESGKPVQGYAIDNMARDARALLDHLGIARANILGYSMGGAIAQEFVRQFPDRVMRLVLCATMCGGMLATYAGPRVQRTMRNLAGLSPEEAARQIWTVTYADGYLATHRDKAEEQMQREISWPTPLHAADLQFQAFAGFDCAAALPSFRCPALVITGDEDRLIPPRNTAVLAALIPGAEKVVLPGLGHRAIWEDTQACLSHIVGFLQGDERLNGATRPFASFNGFLTDWASIYARTTAQMLKLVDDAVPPVARMPFGDGKQILILPGLFTPAATARVLAIWLRAIGYRPRVVPAGEDIATALAKAVERTGRKAVVLAFDGSASEAIEQTQANDAQVAGYILVNGVTDRAERVHRLTYGPMFATSLAQTLHSIPVELL